MCFMHLTNLLPGSSSCIDLIFVSQPNLVMELRFHSSLHQKCYHQIIDAKLNLKIHYRPPYEREIWPYISTKILILFKEQSIIILEKDP